MTDAQPSRWRRAWLWVQERASFLGLGRFILAVVGVAAVVEGFIVAWRVDAATPLLVIGAILAGLGLFNWRELRASYRDVSFALFREAGEIERVAEREDVPNDAREELSEAAANVAAVAAVTATGPTGPGPRQHVLRRTHPAVAARPFHHYLGREGPVVLNLLGSALERYRCVVTQPGGEAVAAQGRREGGQIFPPKPVQCTFPDDFADALNPPAEGEYTVDWYVTGSLLPAISGDVPPHQVARDTFRLPGTAADALMAG